MRTSAAIIIALAVAAAPSIRADEAPHPAAAPGSAGPPGLAASEAESAPPVGPRIDLQTLLAAVAKASKKQFLVDRRAPSTLVLGEIEPAKVTYPLLLSILRNNGLAAATIQGMVNIVPVADIRQYPLPVIFKADAAIPDDEWVTRVLRLKFSDARTLVPVLRPIMPQAGHLAAIEGQNAILIVDRYGNTKRVAELLDAFDQPATQPAGK